MLCEVVATTGNINAILGDPDGLKFRSSIALFAVAAPEESLFEAALKKFFRGESDPISGQPNKKGLSDDEPLYPTFWSNLSGAVNEIPWRAF